MGPLESDPLRQNPVARGPFGAPRRKGAAGLVVVRDPRPAFDPAPGPLAGIPPDRTPGGTRRPFPPSSSRASGTNASLRRNLVRHRHGVLRHRSRWKRPAVRPSLPPGTGRMGVPSRLAATGILERRRSVGRHGSPTRLQARRGGTVFALRRGRRRVRSTRARSSPHRASRERGVRHQILVVRRHLPLVVRPFDGFRPRAFRPRRPARRPGHLRPARQVQEHPMRPGRDDPVVRTTTRFLDSHPPSMNQTQGVLHA